MRGTGYLYTRKLSLVARRGRINRFYVYRRLKGGGQRRYNPGHITTLTLRELIMEDVKDSNGTLLADGDSVTLIKDLKVKGSSITLKRGTRVKNIRLTNDPAEIECNVEKVKGLWSCAPNS